MGDSRCCCSDLLLICLRWWVTIYDVVVPGVGPQPRYRVDLLLTGLRCYQHSQIAPVGVICYLLRYVYVAGALHCCLLLIVAVGTLHCLYVASLPQPDSQPHAPRCYFPGTVSPLILLVNTRCYLVDLIVPLCGCGRG